MGSWLVVGVAGATVIAASAVGLSADGTTGGQPSAGVSKGAVGSHPRRGRSAVINSPQLALQPSLPSYLLPPAGRLSDGEALAAASTTGQLEQASAGENLLSGPNGALHGGWVATGEATVRSVNGTSPGGGELIMTTTGSKSQALWSGSPSNGGLVPATPVAVYTGNARATAGGQAATITPVLAFYNSSGKLLTSLTGQSSEVTSAAPQMLAQVLGFAPLSTSSVALGFVVTGAAKGEQISIEDPTLRAERYAGSAPIEGPLRVVGNQILDRNGSRVILDGFDLYGLQSSAHPPGSLFRQIEEAKAWGANVIRVSLGEQLWLKTSCYYEPDYALVVSQVVKWVTELGMVALLDLHFNSVTPCTPPGQQMMADYPGSVNFWSQVASKFKGNPLVAFGLYNEPHGISNKVWLDGGILLHAPIPYRAAGMQQLYDAVRATGAQNLVMASGLGWARSFPNPKLSGYNIVYSVHAYTCPQVPPPECDTPNPYQAPPILNQWVGPAQSVPVMVTEFGFPDPNSGTYNASVAQFAAAHGWGWIAFALDGTTLGPFDLVSQMPAEGPYEPAPSAMGLVADLIGPGLSGGTVGSGLGSVSPQVANPKPGGKPVAGQAVVKKAGSLIGHELRVHPLAKLHLDTFKASTAQGSAQGCNGLLVHVQDPLDLLARVC